MNLITGTNSNSNSTGNNMTISYTASDGVFKLTNTASSNDPYATIDGQYVYLEKGKRYIINMTVKNSSGALANKIELFYAIIGESYTQSNSMNFFGDDYHTFIALKSGTYRFRLDNDVSHDNGAVVYISDFWIKDCGFDLPT